MKFHKHLLNASTVFIFDHNIFKVCLQSFFCVFVVYPSMHNLLCLESLKSLYWIATIQAPWKLGTTLYRAVVDNEEDLSLQCSAWKDLVF